MTRKQEFPSGIHLEEKEDEAGVVVGLEDLPLCRRLRLTIPALHLSQILVSENFTKSNHLSPPVQEKLGVPEAENGSDEGVLHELQGEPLLDQLRGPLGVFRDVKVLATVSKSSQHL